MAKLDIDVPGPQEGHAPFPNRRGKRTLCSPTDRAAALNHGRAWALHLEEREPSSTTELQGIIPGHGRALDSLDGEPTSPQLSFDHGKLDDALMTTGLSP